MNVITAMHFFCIVIAKISDASTELKQHYVGESATPHAVKIDHCEMFATA